MRWGQSRAIRITWPESAKRLRLTIRHLDSGGLEFLRTIGQPAAQGWVLISPLSARMSAWRRATTPKYSTRGELAVPILHSLKISLPVQGYSQRVDLPATV